jgi:hypothetical protein
MSNNIKSRSIELIKKINFINSDLKKINYIIKFGRSEIKTLNGTLKNLNKNIRNENTIFSVFIKNSDSKKLYQLHKKQLEEYLKSVNKNIIECEYIIESLIEKKHDLEEELHNLSMRYYQKYISLRGRENNKNYYEKLNMMKVLNNKNNNNKL